VKGNTSEENQCLLCKDGTTGCVNHQECRSQCLNPLQPTSPTIPPTNGTPKDLVQTVWRGIQINKDYKEGEIQLKFDDTKAYFYYVALNATKVYTVSFTKDTISLTGDGITSTIYISRYLTNFVAQVVANTVATGDPNGAPPLSFDVAMTDERKAVHVFAKCLNAATCTFHWDGSAPGPKRSISSGASTLAIIDQCSNYSTSCKDCLGQPFCGWCSNEVMYKDGSQGRNCAGYNADRSKNPFVCVGEFSTTICPVAPKSYDCDDKTKKCKQVPGGGRYSDLNVCNTQCSQPPPPPNNVTPIDLQGFWRGLQIQDGYQVGEFKALFSATNAQISNSNGTVLIAGDVQSLNDQIWINTERGVLKGIWQNANGPVTKIAGIAFGIMGKEAPKDFAVAMQTKGMSEFVFVSCLPSKITDGICVFRGGNTKKKYSKF